MSAQNPLNPTSQSVAQLLPKLHHVDPDYRFMSLNDLFQILTISKHDFLHNDYNTAARVVDGIVKSLDDQNGEVQNLAIKCLAPLVNKIPSSILVPLIEKLSTLTTQNSLDNSITSVALRTVIVTLPRPVSGIQPSKEVLDAYSAISRVLIPKLVGRNINPRSGKEYVSHSSSNSGKSDLDVNNEIKPEAVDVLIEVVRCFGPLLNETEISALRSNLISKIDEERVSSIVKKRAVVALSIVAVYLTDERLGDFVSQIILSLRDFNLPLSQRKIYISVIGQLARSIPHRIGKHMNSLAPFVLDVLNQQELTQQLGDSADQEHNPEKDDVREAALIALDGCLSSCGSEMFVYTEDVILALFRFLKYDPNYNEDIDEEMSDTQLDCDDNDFSDDEDFEANATFDDDDDDSSWKIRRCAAKALYTLISTRGSGDLLEDSTLFSKIAPLLLQRFSEREESVRLEIIATMASLIRKTGEISYANFSLTDSSSFIKNVPQSRKRRRESSTKDFDTKEMMSISSGLISPVVDPIPATGPRAELAKLSPMVVIASIKLLKGSSIPTKQALINLLDDIVSAQYGGLSEQFSLIVDPIVEAIKVSSSPTSTSFIATTATANSLRIAALRLIGSIASTHSSGVLHPHLFKIIPPVIAAANDKNYKISGEAIGTIEHLVKALTPPRSLSINQSIQSDLQQLYQTILNRVSTNDADLEVRQRAIQTLGILLARTSNRDGQTLLSCDDHTLALNLLSERLKNETTRLAAVHAINTVAVLANMKNWLRPEWIRDVSLELSAQFRKSNRSLRGASLAAMKNLLVTSAAASSLDSVAIKSIVVTILPLLTYVDLHLLSPALLVLATLVKNNPKLVVTDKLNSALCELLKANLGSSVIESLLELVANIGSNGVGQTLMFSLLNHVNVNSDPSVVGKVIGTLLVHGGPSVGVSIDDFSAEIINSDSDDLRRCLALTVLGEAGLRLGDKSKLTAATFTSQFSTGSDKVRLASAIALGRAGAGNTHEFVPEIIKYMNFGGNVQYLLLHSIKEIIHQARNNKADIMEYIQLIWEKLIKISQADENKAVGAECIGRLVIIKPKTYLPELQNYLSDPNPSVRAMTIQALRYTLIDGDDSFEIILAKSIVEILSTMLRDTEIENRRLALTTLSSAAHNKPGLIIPNLTELLPFVMHESVIKTEFIREVPMGPFKHKIDDGLEVRKSAYETLYSLMEIAFSRLSILTFYDRVIAGLQDQHEIRALCTLMLTKIVVLDPEETARRLDSIADAFKSILSVKLKDNAVKQEIEKQEEAIRSVLRVTLLLHGSIPSASAALGSIHGNQGWRTYWEWVEKDFEIHLRGLKEEIKSVE
ncbi:Cullin-associated NEDD8-dissociated protein 1, C-terminal part [Golovinomyces cichoracearum]|uniref:Cullin-associated NEDD8-dissociated protein 1, C-terminal part n=1 Tax=Golovinomyces cichoracearum TaxID=62708 RepID=A0A420I1L0_9PEZI|nr:Cullin-associated NEDD8-dissociated protein 1, C-terminal part [Golovinomyces cichoracearum]